MPPLDYSPHRKLFAALYPDLRRIAARELRRNAAAVVSPTTLLHESYLNLPEETPEALEDEHRFMAYVARIMRNLVVDHLRARGAQKRGGQYPVTTLPTDAAELVQPDMAIDQLGEAMEILAVSDSRLAQVVDLKFFCGFSLSEIARMWHVSERTLQRDWDKARLRLRQLIDAQTGIQRASSGLGAERPNGPSSNPT
jgi:RNA polymerase sigma factor (TIGR02999 family)